MFLYKYGIKQGIKAIREYVENGNPSYFTNDNQARTTLIKMFTPDQVKSIIITSENSERVPKTNSVVFYSFSITIKA